MIYAMRSAFRSRVAEGILATRQCNVYPPSIRLISVPIATRDLYMTTMHRSAAIYSNSVEPLPPSGEIPNNLSMKSIAAASFLFL